jgi:hypothetical protein
VRERDAQTVDNETNLLVRIYSTHISRLQALIQDFHHAHYNAMVKFLFFIITYIRASKCGVAPAHMR